MRANGLSFDAVPRISFFGKRSTRSFNAVATGCGSLLIVYAAWVAFQISQSVQETGIANQKILALRSARVQLQKPKPGAETAGLDGAAASGLSVATISPTTLGALNGVILQLNLPWHDIFEQLEKSIPPEVALLSIEPDGQRRQIRLQAEAKSLDALLRYASSLQHKGIFGRLNYTRHETNDQDPNRPVRLSFELGLSAPARLTEASPSIAQEGASR